MYDGIGVPEAKYWIARNRLRQKFGLTAAEADLEDPHEVAIHLHIWDKITERQEREIKRESSRNQTQR